MDATLKLWSIVAIVGVLNYLSRLSFIAIFARRQVPPLLARAFRYVPAAMLTALVLPMVVAPSGGEAADLSSRVSAAVIAGVAAWFTRNTLATLGAGMLALWTLHLVARAIG